MDPSTEQEPIAAEEQVAAPAALPVNASNALVVELWFQDHFHNSVASVDPTIYSMLHAAKEDLKKRLS